MGNKQKISDDEVSAFDVIGRNLSEIAFTAMEDHFNKELNKYIKPLLKKTSFMLDGENLDFSKARILKVLTFYVKSYKKINDERKFKRNLDDFKISYKGKKVEYNILLRFYHIFNNIKDSEYIMQQHFNKEYQEIITHINKLRQEILLLVNRFYLT